MSVSSKRDTRVSMFFLPSGACLSIDISLSPERARLRLRGIGVAESERTCTLCLRAFIFSLSLTPNLCSSSMIMSQRFLNVSFSERTLWVPIRISIFPSASFFCICVNCFWVVRRETISIFMSNDANLSKAFS